MLNYASAPSLADLFQPNFGSWVSGMICSGFGMQEGGQSENQRCNGSLTDLTSIGGIELI